MDKPLTFEMIEAIEAIRANGGHVGNWLNAYKAIGTNGRAVKGLLNRRMAVLREVDGTVCVVLV